MKIIAASLIFILSHSISLGQDGSDIKYVSIKNLNRSYTGKFVHLDFYRKYRHLRVIDSITITIDNIPIRFIEHRVDDGLNQWFSQQYLLSLDEVEGMIIKIVKCKVVDITKDSILVKNYLEYYSSDNKSIAKRTRQLLYWFKKSDIVEVLVKFDWKLN